MTQDPGYWSFKVNKALEILFNRDPGSRFPIRVRLDKQTSLDIEELDWLRALFYFVDRTRKRSKYSYRWTERVPQIVWVTVEGRRMLGVIERSFKGNHDLDLTQ